MPRPDIPDLRQEKSFDCGVFALLAVLRGFKVGPVAPDDLAGLLRTSKQKGTSPQDILRVAREVGLAATPPPDDAPRLTIGSLRAWTRPDVGRVVLCPVQRGGTPGQQERATQGHWVVVLRVNDDGDVTVQDPAAGRRTIKREGWLERWHDVSAKGDEYVRYGIAIGRPDATMCEEWAESDTAEFAPTPYVGPLGGKGWRLDSGRIIYGDLPAKHRVRSDALAGTTGHLAGYDPRVDSGPGTAGDPALPITERLARFELGRRVVEALTAPGLLRERELAGLQQEMEKRRLRTVAAGINAERIAFDHQAREEVAGIKDCYERIVARNNAARQYNRLVDKVRDIDRKISHTDKDRSFWTREARGTLFAILHEAVTDPVTFKVATPDSRFRNQKESWPVLQALQRSVQRVPGDPGEVNMHLKAGGWHGSAVLLSERGHFRLRTTYADFPSTVGHEFGHIVEMLGITDLRPGAAAGLRGDRRFKCPALDASNAFLGSRVPAGAPWRTMAHFQNDPEPSDYRIHVRESPALEKAMPKFQAAYMTRRYPNGLTEVASTALERLIADPAGLARDDPELCKLAVGYLTGHLRRHTA